SQDLSNWIWANRDALAANAFDDQWFSLMIQPPIGDYLVPNKFPGTQTWFRGSLNNLAQPNLEFWNAPPPPGFTDSDFEWSNARFHFSAGTCRGCHGAEVGAASFMIIGPGDGWSGAPLVSAFLAGEVDVPDPVTGSTRLMNEPVRRENDLRNLANGAPVLVPVFGNNYTVVFRTGSKCMDSAGNNTTDGAFTQLFSCHGNANQRLSLVSAGTGVYNLKYKHSGKCIDVQNGSTSDGARVVQMTCSSSRASQKLALLTQGVDVAAPPLSRVLRFQHSNLCLTVQGQGTADSTPIIQTSCPDTNDVSKGFDLVE